MNEKLQPTSYNGCNYLCILSLMSQSKVCSMCSANYKIRSDFIFAVNDLECVFVFHTASLKISQWEISLPQRNNKIHSVDILYTYICIGFTVNITFSNTFKQHFMGIGTHFSAFKQLQYNHSTMNPWMWFSYAWFHFVLLLSLYFCSWYSYVEELQYD